MSREIEVTKSSQSTEETDNAVGYRGRDMKDLGDSMRGEPQRHSTVEKDAVDENVGKS